MELRELRYHDELYPVGHTMDAAYFIESGVISIVTLMEDGSSVESATVGYEGFAGAPLLLGERHASQAHLVQAQVTAYALPAHRFQAIIEELPALRAACNRYLVGLLGFMAQTTACNRLHTVDERCARWLLLMHDRIRADEFPLTQAFLAQMLGVRRPSGTVAAGLLQQAGLIAYRRGKVAIRNRSALEDASCECYAVIQSRFAAAPMLTSSETVPKSGRVLAHDLYRPTPAQRRSSDGRQAVHGAASGLG